MGERKNSTNSQNVFLCNNMILKMYYLVNHMLSYDKKYWKIILVEIVVFKTIQLLEPLIRIDF